ncbi:MAG: hypothetical protein LQ338_002221 [Usnochroma carphineum]|nr:MAG: hypothetical protein LQ338_002221 [Usnochroma carphineum]
MWGLRICGGNATMYCKSDGCCRGCQAGMCKWFVGDETRDWYDLGCNEETTPCMDFDNWPKTTYKDCQCAQLNPYDDWGARNHLGCPSIWGELFSSSYAVTDRRGSGSSKTHAVTSPARTAEVLSA